MSIPSKKVVIISGAASGIGLELAQYYYNQNYFVVGLDYNLTNLQTQEQRFPKIDWIQVDVSNKEQMLAAAKRIVDGYKRVDIVIANAGVGGLNPASNFSLEVHEKTVNINCLGLAYTLMPFIPYVLQSRGSLVAISSMAAFRGLPLASSYSSTKSQQMVFMESLRVELGKKGVHVMSVHPGFVKTAMTLHDEFDMPFMVTAQDAAFKIAKAISKRQSSLLFPWPMKLATMLNRILPNWLYDWLVPRVSKMKANAQARIF